MRAALPAWAKQRRNAKIRKNRGNRIPQNATETQAEQADAEILALAERYADDKYGAYVIESDALETTLLGAMK